MTAERKIGRALLSVSQKIGLVTFAQTLAELGVELVSTGGTRKALQEAGLKVCDIADLTGFPEMLDGRVKTLHPHVHGGILFRRELAEHRQTVEKHGITPIDLVVCNLYPFEAVASGGGSPEEILENIDIGGPTLVRAAAKNYRDVAVVVDPEQYASVIDELRGNRGALSFESREKLAWAAFARVADYDRAIAAYFARLAQAEPFPAALHLHFERRSLLRYGENPHQQAAFYAEPGCGFASLANARQLNGKELSFNNILDLDSALGLVREFARPAGVVIKHHNPCGAAVADSLDDAFRKAYEGDPLSAYGGVLGFNRPLDASTAQLVTEPNRFVEAIVAPDFSPEALELLTTRPTWKASVRLLSVGKLEAEDRRRDSLDMRRIEGGLLLQSRDLGNDDDLLTARVVTQRQPSETEWDDLRFAWRVVKHVKSNAIVFTKGGMVVGVGAGQMSRVDSVHLAGRKAGERAIGAVMASDAFFPFRDNIDQAAQAGITAVVQPGGSIRDKDSIQAADEHGLAMVVTGVRHFRH